MISATWEQTDSQSFQIYNIIMFSAAAWLLRGGLCMQKVAGSNPLQTHAKTNMLNIEPNLLWFNIIVFVYTYLKFYLKAKHILNANLKCVLLFHFNIQFIQELLSKVLTVGICFFFFFIVYVYFSKIVNLKNYVLLTNLKQ